MRRPVEFKDFPAKLAPPNDYGPYRAVVKHIVDGDTYDVYVSLGLFHYAYETVRLAGLDTPEINSGTDAYKQRGRAARARASELILGKPVLLRTYKDTQTFGRFVAQVFYQGADGGLYNLAETLEAEGHAK